MERFYPIFALSLVVWFGLTTVSCASSPYMMPESDLTSTAPGEALNDFSIRKAMPDRRKFQAWEFYYKHCSASSEHSTFSINDYDCNGPYY